MFLNGLPHGIDMERVEGAVCVLLPEHFQRLVLWRGSKGEETQILVLAVGDHLPHQTVLCVLQFILRLAFQLCILLEGVMGIRQGHFQLHGALPSLAAVSLVHNDSKGLAGGIVHLLIDDGELLQGGIYDPLAVVQSIPQVFGGLLFIDGHHRTKGVVKAGDAVFELDYKEALYLGSGDREVTFESKDVKNPAQFYFNSVTAHRNYPDKKVTKADAIVAEMGSLEGSNHRCINKMLVSQVLPTCQLQMGMTELKPGSVWNTMPAHVHSRRMEAYFYFEVPDEHAVCHFMGEVDETRHIWMKGDQAVLSPEWSIHSAAATHNYTFIWGMGGENLDYGDQDFSLITDLK